MSDPHGSPKIDNQLSINPKHAMDKCYRYKMPCPEIKFEGNGTVIENMVRVCRSLKIDPDFLHQFLGTRKGTKIKKSAGRYILSGIVELPELVKMLYEFISIFILCPKCGNPETTRYSEVLVQKKKKKKKDNGMKMVHLRCIACGHCCELTTSVKAGKSVLATMKKILPLATNEPIDEKGSSAEGVSAEDGSAEDDIGGQTEDDDDWSTDDDWDTSPEAVAERRTENCGAIDVFT